MAKSLKRGYLLAFCALLLLSSCFVAPATDDVRGLTDYFGDAAMLVGQVEAVHPIFSLGRVPDGYKAARREYLAVSAKPMTLDDFALRTQKYIAVLGDGHMGSGIAGVEDAYIDVSWAAVDGKLCLLDVRRALTGAEVTHIGGVDVRIVMDIVDEYFAAENEAARQLNYTANCRAAQMLALAGCRFTGEKVTLTLSDGSELDCGFMVMDAHLARGIRSHNYIVRTDIIGDVFHVNLRTFTLGESIDEACAQMEQAVADGFTKFIIDVRGNPGGSVAVCRRLLRALGHEPPDYGVYTRASALAAEMRGTSYRSSSFVAPNPDSAVCREGITLLVLTNALSFSSSTMLASMVRDGGLGKIVGQTSANSPNAYGDMLPVTLPESGIRVFVSHKLFMRPDQNADHYSLVPDIEVPIGGDIYQTAMDYMATVE